MGNSTRLWIAIIVCVTVALFVINLFRVNPPTPSTEASPTPVVMSHTEGPIVTGRVNIEPGAFLQYKLNFNYKSTVKGTFRISNREPRIACLILNESNFEKWKAGEEFVAATSTGSVPRGHITRTLDSGVYYLVLDNRASKDKVGEIDTDFYVE